MELQIGSYFLPELWKHCLLFSSFQICCREVYFLLIFSSLNMASMCSLKTFRIFPLSSVLCYFQFRDVCLKYFYDNFLPSILSSLFPEPLLLDVGLLDWFSNFLGVFFFLCFFFLFFLQRLFLNFVFWLWSWILFQILYFEFPRTFLYSLTVVVLIASCSFYMGYLLFLWDTN